MSQSLLTQGIRAKVPPIYATDEVSLEDKEVAVKFFTPMSNWTWYAFEGEPIIEEGVEVDFEFFGLVVGHEKEMGYFRLSEFDKINRSHRMPLIERDEWFAGKVPDRDLPSHITRHTEQEVER